MNKKEKQRNLEEDKVEEVLVYETEEDEDYFFTCEDCGCHDLGAVQEWTVTESCTSILPCKCEGSDNGTIAAEQTWYVTRVYQQLGCFDEDGRLEWERTEEIDCVNDSDDPEYFCDECSENAEDEDWEHEEEETEKDDDSEETYAYCIGCDRKVEYEWD